MGKADDNTPVCCVTQTRYGKDADPCDAKRDLYMLTRNLAFIGEGRSGGLAYASKSLLPTESDWAFPMLSVRGCC